MVERNELIRLVTNAQAGDKVAVAALYDNFHEDTYFFIKSMVIDPDLSADLTQDTFVEVLNKIGTLQEPAAFVSWIRQIAYHKSVNHFKKAKAITVEEDEDGYSVFDTLEEDRTEFIPDAALDQEDFKATILKMLLELPETQRSALVLHYYEEYPVKQIAQIQGVSEGTVKSRLNYGRNALKQAVENYEKKNGIKLHCVGIIPLLLWLFGQGVLVRNTGVTTVSGAATASAAAAGAKAGSFIKLMAVIGLSAAVVTGAIFATVKLRSPRDEANTPETTEETEGNDPDASEDETTTPSPNGSYDAPSVYIGYAEIPVYTKDGYVYCYTENGPVQLTQQEYSVDENTYFPYTNFVKATEDKHYVYYPDNVRTGVDGIFGSVIYDLYFRDLQALDAPPVKVISDATEFTEYQISTDGLRIVYKDYSIGGFTVCHLTTAGITQTYSIASGFDLGSQPYHWTNDLSYFLYVKPLDLNDIGSSSQLYLWHNGETKHIGEISSTPMLCYDDTGNFDAFYYTDLSNNLYYYDIVTGQLEFRMENVAHIVDIPTKDIFYFMKANPYLYDITDQEYYQSYVDFDTGETQLQINLINMDHEAFVIPTMTDYFYYDNGEVTCIAANAFSYKTVGDMTIIGEYHPELIEKVKFSEYGADGVAEEVLRRIADTFRWCVYLETDTLVLPGSVRTAVQYDLMLNGILFYQEDGTTFQIPIENGKFGQMQEYQLTESEGYFETGYTDEGICIHFQTDPQNNTAELYVGGQLIAQVPGCPSIYDQGFLCYTDFDSSTGLGTLAIVYANSQTVIAENAYIADFLFADDTLYYLQSEQPGSYIGDLYMYRDGISTLLDTNVQLNSF